MDFTLDWLIDKVRQARIDKTPLCIRGGGSKDFYGGAPQGKPLDVRMLAGISHYDPSELVVSARAGTPLADLETVLAEKKQCLAFEPPRFAASSTVGGMVAAGLAGPARASAGSVRDHLLGATLLNGKAEVMSFGGQVMKNVAGYDVARVLPGSLGVLGVILEVSLKVVPMPAATTTLRFELNQVDALLRLRQWGRQPLPINASAWWSGMLVIRLAGARAAVTSAAQQLGGEKVEDAMAADFWGSLRDHSDEFFSGAAKAVQSGASLWRLSVPQSAPPLPLSGEQLIEWGGGQRWVVTSAPAASMREVALCAGGHATCFRGAKADGAFAPLSPTMARIQREIKNAFDPDGIFNRGRLVSEW